MQTMKIAVVGTTGCGKTTFSAELARRTGIPHHQLDALAWGDDWTEIPDDELNRRVDRVLDVGRWIIDGNYSRAGIRERLFTEADAIAWLDLPRRVVWPRILSRSIRRAWTKERLWGTNNRESFRLSFLSKDSVILWSITSFVRRRRTYEQLLRSDDTIAAKFRRARSRRAVRHLLDEMATEACPPPR
jgi:adenylate kinase family enzyme